MSTDSLFEYPAVGFHFLVVFELPQFPNDIRFQEVSGLNVSVEYEESRKEGGENRFVHQLPKGLKYDDITFKRGKFMGSGILHWFKKALEDFEFKPVNIMISLLNEDHAPLYNWYVINAVPKSLQVSGFNAQQGEVVVESLTVSYQYFKYYDPASAALDLIAGATGAVGVNVGL